MRWSPITLARVRRRRIDQLAEGVAPPRPCILRAQDELGPRLTTTLRLIAGGGRDDPPAPAIAVAVKAAYADAARWANEGGSVVAEGAHPDR